MIVMAVLYLAHLALLGLNMYAVAMVLATIGVAVLTIRDTRREAKRAEQEDR